MLFIQQRAEAKRQTEAEGPQRITPGEDGWSGYGEPPPQEILGQIPWEPGADPNLN